MRRYIKYLIIIFILFFSTNVSAKTYGLVDNPDECSYDACFTEPDDILTDAEDEDSNITVNFESTKTDFKISSHEFSKTVLFSIRNKREYTIDGEGSNLKSDAHFSIRSFTGCFYNLKNINFYSKANSINLVPVVIRRNNYDGGIIKNKLMMDFIGVALYNPKSIDNVTSTINGEFEYTRTPLFIANDHFMDDNDEPIYVDVDVNNVTTTNSTNVGMALLGGKYNINNFNSDCNISIHGFFYPIININNSTIRSLISSEGSVINVNSNNKWYQDEKIFFLNKIIAEGNKVLSDETLSYIRDNEGFNYIVTDEGTINIKDVKEEKIDLKNKKIINISELFPYLGNVNLNEEEWTSSNTDVATIDEGIITIKSAGETTFTTTPKDTQTVLEYKLIVTEQKIDNPKTSNNLIVLVSSLLLLLTLVLLFKRNKKEF